MPTLPFSSTRARRFAAGLLLLTLAGTSAALAQLSYRPTSPAGRLEVAPTLGWSGPRPSAALELRVALGDHFVGAVRAGTEPWRASLAGGAKTLTGAAFEGAELNGGFSFGGGIRAYSGPERTGVFGGVDLARQAYEIDVDSRLPQPDALTFNEFNFFSAAIALASALTPDRRGARSLETTGAATVLTITGGYAFDLGPGERLELCARMVRRSIPGNATYGVEEAEGVREFGVNDDFRTPLRPALEARWVLPL